MEIDHCLTELLVILSVETLSRRILKLHVSLPDEGCRARSKNADAIYVAALHVKQTLERRQPYPIGFPWVCFRREYSSAHLEDCLLSLRVPEVEPLVSGHNPAFIADGIWACPPVMVQLLSSEDEGGGCGSMPRSVRSILSYAELTIRTRQGDLLLGRLPFASHALPAGGIGASALLLSRATPIVFRDSRILGYLFSNPRRQDPTLRVRSSTASGNLGSLVTTHPGSGCPPRR